MDLMQSNFTQVVTLPSKGLLNPEIPNGEITQRCMMVADQKFLSGSSQGAESAINQILQRTITVPENFDVSKLTLPDSLYLLFKLRVLSYGSKYTFRSRCPECGEKIDISLDLSEIPVTYLNDDYAGSLVATLPHRGDIVYTRLLTNHDLEEVNKELKRRKKRSPDDDSGYVLRIARSIDKIVFAKPDEDGRRETSSPFEIERYIESLTDLDASTILHARDSVNYGISPIVECVCPECHEYIDVSLRFSPEFFRPSLG